MRGGEELEEGIQSRSPEFLGYTRILGYKLQREGKKYRGEERERKAWDTL